MDWQYFLSGWHEVPQGAEALSCTLHTGSSGDVGPRSLHCQKWELVAWLDSAALSRIEDKMTEGSTHVWFYYNLSIIRPFTEGACHTKSNAGSFKATGASKMSYSLRPNSGCSLSGLYSRCCPTNPWPKRICWFFCGKLNVFEHISTSLQICSHFSCLILYIYIQYIYIWLILIVYSWHLKVSRSLLESSDPFNPCSFKTWPRII